MQPSLSELQHAQKVLEYVTRMLDDVKTTIWLELPVDHPVHVAVQDANEKVAVLTRRLFDTVRRLPR